jgi:cold shock protein
MKKCRIEHSITYKLSSTASVYFSPTYFSASRSNVRRFFRIYPKRCSILYLCALCATECEGGNTDFQPKLRTKTAMSAGTVKFHNGDSFGFISRDDGSGEIFVHISNCAEDIEELVQGQRVRFDEQISKRSGKPEAIAVELM